MSDSRCSEGKPLAKAALPVIAVTPGEPGGVGPEITARLFARYSPSRSVALIIGAYPVLLPWLRAFRASIASIEVGGSGRRAGVVDLETVSSALARAIRPRRGALPRVAILDTGSRDRFTVGRDSRGGGRHAGRAIEMACRLASVGVIEGIVTGPISKRSLQLGGYPFAGHTEFLSRHFDAPDCQMVMVHGGFRVVPLTRHLPLRDVHRAVSVEGIIASLRVVTDSLKRDFGIERPLIAVTGLNPHAGDGGVLGREEIDVIRPALRRARRMGLRVEGPVSADALFQRARSGTFDAFLAMYHDQGLIPFKMLSKRRGVNVTIGLPVVRTSVDHGVAYDIAGKGKASAGSLEQAYRLAETLVSRRRKRMR